MVIVVSWKIEVLQKAKTAFKHWEQIDRIRSFSRTVAFATARTGKIVKTGMEISAAASIIWMNWSLLTNDHNCIDIVWFGTMLWWYTMSCRYNMTNSFKIISMHNVVFNLCTYSHVLQFLQWTCACRIQSLHKVVSNLYLFNSLLTTYTQLPTISPQGCNMHVRL